MWTNKDETGNIIDVSGFPYELDGHQIKRFWVQEFSDLISYPNQRSWWTHFL